MASSVLAEALAQPVTTCLALVLVAVFVLLHSRRIGYADVGLSYSRVVTDRELWRCATAQLCHIDLLHLVFNISALWSIGLVERTPQLGPLYFMQQTTLLFLLSPVICLALYHLLIVVGKREQYCDVTAVGYSAVLFGWMTLLATKQPGGITMLPLFGLASVPMWATPWASLLLTSLLIPRASFAGHLAGILAGYAVALGLFAWLPPWWTVSLLLWVALGLAWAAARAQQLAVPSYMRLPGGTAGLWGGGGGDVESGGGGSSRGVRITAAGEIVRK